MKIYTRTGDDGTTALFGGGRVSKAHARVVAYGTVDELNASLGLARSACAKSTADAELDSVLGEIQCMLFEIGAILATPAEASKAAAARTNPITDSDIQHIEQTIDRFSEALPELQSFVLPGGSETASRLHLARTVCRRAEREIVALIETELGKNSPEVEHEHAQAASRRVLTWLNRLSDLLFVLARYSNHAEHVDDVPWQARTRPE